MFVTSYLPALTPPWLAAMATILLALTLACRMVARWRSEPANRGGYKQGMHIAALIASAGFTAIAFSGIMDSLAIGEMISLLYGAGMIALCVIVIFKIMRGGGGGRKDWPNGGRIIFGRLPISMYVAVVIQLYVAVIGYTQSVFANLGGSASGSAWWAMCRGALVAADVVFALAVIWSIVSLVVSIIGALRRP